MPCPVTLLLTAAGTAALVTAAYPAPPETKEVVMWSMVPLSGAFFGALVAYLFWDTAESGKQVAGRALCAVAGGVLTPRGIIVYKPEWGHGLNDPLILWGLGIFCAILYYAASRPALARIFKSAPTVVNQQIDRILPKNETSNDGNSGGAA